MIRRTLITIRPVIIKNLGRIAWLLILSIVLGVIPTFKSELEAAVVDSINNVITNRNSSEIFDMPVSRFSTVDESNQTDFVIQLIYYFFVNISLINVIIFYTGIVAVGALVTVILKTLQSDIDREIFVKLRGEAMKRALLTEPCELPVLANVAGQHTTAIQQGAVGLSNAYSYLLELLQYAIQLA